MLAHYWNAAELILLLLFVHAMITAAAIMRLGKDEARGCEELKGSFG